MFSNILYKKICIYNTFFYFLQIIFNFLVYFVVKLDFLAKIWEKFGKRSSKRSIVSPLLQKLSIFPDIIGN